MNNNAIQLNLYLSRSGVCSRRDAVEVIKNGLVSVNDEVVREPGFRVLETDVVKFKDKVLKIENKVYLLLNKPKGYVTTLEDEKKRKTVMDLIKLPSRQRLFPVGRLDRDTTGLLLITNDGDLAQQLAHPKFKIIKEYFVVLDKPIDVEHFQQLKQGIYLPDGRAKIDKIRYGKTKKHVEVQIHSGKNRIIRRMFAHLGFKVTALDRYSFAGLTKKGLPVGTWRYLTKQEVNDLLNSGK